MRNNAWSTYQQNEVLDAAPIRLVVLLYRAAIEAVGKARTHQMQNERRERSVQITRAFEILLELAGAVDLERGGELAPRLLQLYDYMQQQLNRANVEQITAPLDDVEALLANLLEGWEGVQAQLAAPWPSQLLPTDMASDRKALSYSA